MRIFLSFYLLSITVFCPLSSAGRMQPHSYSHSAYPIADAKRDVELINELTEKFLKLVPGNPGFLHDWQKLKQSVLAARSRLIQSAETYRDPRWQDDKYLEEKDDRESTYWSTTKTVLNEPIIKFLIPVIVFFGLKAVTNGLPGDPSLNALAGTTLAVALNYLNCNFILHQLHNLSIRKKIASNVKKVEEVVISILDSSELYSLLPTVLEAELDRLDEELKKHREKPWAERALKEIFGFRIRLFAGSSITKDLEKFKESLYLSVDEDIEELLFVTREGHKIHRGALNEPKVADLRDKKINSARTLYENLKIAKSPEPLEKTSINEKEYFVQNLLSEPGAELSQVRSAIFFDENELEHAVAIKTSTSERLAPKLIASALSQRELSDVPGVIPVLDIDLANKAVVMKPIEGMNLASILKSEKKPNENELITIVLSVAQSMAQAHEKGILHADLKPEQVLIAADNENLENSFRVYVTDFSPQQTNGNTNSALSSITSLPSLTTAPYTPAFASPEQLKNLPLDARVDVYGLGALLYSTLTGETPSIDYDPISNLNKNISAELAKDLDGLLKKVLVRREKRLPSVNQFITELSRIAGKHVNSEDTQKDLVLTALYSSIQFHKEKLKKVEIQPAPAIEVAPTVEATPLQNSPLSQASSEMASLPELSSLTRSRPDLDAIFAAQRCKKELGARQVVEE